MADGNRPRHAPPQILNVRPGQPVELRVAKRLDESYQPSPKETFSGAGNRLGAPVPSLAPNAPAGSMPGSFPSGDASSSGTGSASTASNTKFEVDQTKPTTSVQIRLADGTRLVISSIVFPLAVLNKCVRMVCRMNLTHTVLDLRNFINAYGAFGCCGGLLLISITCRSRPENLMRPYTLGTTFPSRLLEDNLQTIEGAKLMNSVVVQRWA
jgi:UBX domain-containing protein 1